MIRLSSIALLAAFGFAAFNLSAMAQAAPGSPPVGGGDLVAKPDARGEGFGDRDRDRFIEKLFKGITLGDDQKDALEKLKEAKRAEMKQFHEEHKAELDAFHKSMKAWYELNKGKFEAIRKTMREASDSRDKESLKKTQLELKALLETRAKVPESLKAGMPNLEKIAESIRPILTADQTKTFDENIQKMEEMKKKMEDGGFTGRPGREGDKKDGAPPRRRMQKEGEKKAE